MNNNKIKNIDFSINNKIRANKNFIQIPAQILRSNNLMMNLLIIKFQIFHKNCDFV